MAGFYRVLPSFLFGSSVVILITNETPKLGKTRYISDDLEGGGEGEPTSDPPGRDYLWVSFFNQTFIFLVFFCFFLIFLVPRRAASDIKKRLRLRPLNQKKNNKKKKKRPHTHTHTPKKATQSNAMPSNVHSLNFHFKIIKPVSSVDRDYCFFYVS